MTFAAHVHEHFDLLRARLRWSAESTFGQRVLRLFRIHRRRRTNARADEMTDGWR